MRATESVQSETARNFSRLFNESGYNQKSHPVKRLRPNQPKASFPVINVRPLRDNTDNSDRNSQKLPEARNGLVRNVGVGHADNCQQEYGDIRQFPPQKARRRTVQGISSILRQLRFAPQQIDPEQSVSTAPESPGHLALARTPMSFAYRFGHPIITKTIILRDV